MVAGFGSLFMVAGKRYSELHTLGSEAGHPPLAGPLHRHLPALRVEHRRRRRRRWPTACGRSSSRRRRRPVAVDLDRAVRARPAALRRRHRRRSGGRAGGHHPGRPRPAGDRRGLDRAGRAWGCSVAERATCSHGWGRTAPVRVRARVDRRRRRGRRTCSGTPDRAGWSPAASAARTATPPRTPAETVLLPIPGETRMDGDARRRLGRHVLHDLMRYLLPRGRFLPVTPGHPLRDRRRRDRLRRARQEPPPGRHLRRPRRLRRPGHPRRRRPTGSARRRTPSCSGRRSAGWA